MPSIKRHGDRSPQQYPFLTPPERTIGTLCHPFMWKNICKLGFLSPPNLGLEIFPCSPPESSRGQQRPEDKMEMKFSKLNIGKLKKIKVGTATKHKKVKFDLNKIVSLYKSGKPVSQIALALGFPANCGQNRTR